MSKVPLQTPRLILPQISALSDHTDLMSANHFTFFTPHPPNSQCPATTTKPPLAAASSSKASAPPPKSQSTKRRSQSPNPIPQQKKSPKTEKHHHPREMASQMKSQNPVPSRGRKKKLSLSERLPHHHHEQAKQKPSCDTKSPDGNVYANPTPPYLISSPVYPNHLLQLDERLKREGTKTHKERVEELNRYLSNLSEHHDMYVSLATLHLHSPSLLIAETNSTTHTGRGSDQDKTAHTIIWVEKRGVPGVFAWVLYIRNELRIINQAQLTSTRTTNPPSQQLSRK